MAEENHRIQNEIQNIFFSFLFFSKKIKLTYYYYYYYYFSLLH